MALTDPQLEEFKTSFTQQLADFMQKRKDDIGDPGDWKASGSNQGRFVFRHNESKKEISFTIDTWPDTSEKDAVAVREAAYQICAEHGFTRRKSKISGHTSEPKLPAGTTKKCWPETLKHGSSL